MKTLPRLRFAHLPTPVESLPRLSKRLGGPRLAVKRDDQTGLGMGGNKTRKLEFLLGDAQAQGARTLITAGAAQSNHCRQTAAAAARFGFDCILVLSFSGQMPTGQEQALTGNLLLDRLMGAEIVWTSLAERQQTLEDVFRQSEGAGRRPYLIPYGGSNETGAAGYVFAMQELLEAGFNPDWIVFASSSGGTQSGLALGARLYGYQGNLLGVSVDEPAGILKERVARLANETARHLEVQEAFTPEDILVSGDYLGGGYGVVGALEKEAIELFAHSEGLLLDPVYTGRAAGGMVDLIRQGFFPSDDEVLFWHTGGQPALFADRYQSELVTGG